MDDKLFKITHKLLIEKLYQATDRFSEQQDANNNYVQENADTSSLEFVKNNIIKQIPSIIEPPERYFPGSKREDIKGTYIAKTELIFPNKLNIIIKGKSDEENIEIQSIFEKLVNREFVMYNSDVRIIDYSRDENTHIAHVVVPERYLR